MTLFRGRPMRFRNFFAGMLVALFCFGDAQGALIISPTDSSWTDQDHIDLATSLAVTQAALFAYDR